MRQHALIWTDANLSRTHYRQYINLFQLGDGHVGQCCDRQFAPPYCMEFEIPGQQILGFKYSMLGLSTYCNRHNSGIPSDRLWICQHLHSISRLGIQIIFRPFGGYCPSKLCSSFGHIHPYCTGMTMVSMCLCLSFRLLTFYVGWVYITFRFLWRKAQNSKCHTLKTLVPLLKLVVHLFPTVDTLWQPSRYNGAHLY
jgi:hypothetical protein